LRGALAVMVLAGAALVTRAASSSVPSTTSGFIVVKATNGLVAINPLNGTRTTLAGTDAGDDAPSVAPNGAKIAFARNSGPGGTSRVFIADYPTGTNRQQVTSSTADFPDWSPDSSRLVFECSQGLCTAAASVNAPVTVLAGSLAGDLDPVYSPDGAFVAFSDLGGANTGIFHVNADGSGVRTHLTNSVLGDRRPMIAPNASVVWFDDGAAGSGILSLPWPDGGVRKVLPDTLATDINPAPSPDGTKVSLETTTPNIATVNANGTGGRAPLPGTATGDIEPFWARPAGAVTPPPTATPTSTPTAGPNVNPNAPVFSAASGCGVPVSAPALGGGLTTNISASDADSGQTVTITMAASAPPYASFSSPGTGNPDTGVLRLTPSLIDWLLGIFGGTANVTLIASDSGTPQKATNCIIPVRVSLGFLGL
jgi:Tol biopolymer transport system component